MYCYRWRRGIGRDSSCDTRKKKLIVHTLSGVLLSELDASRLCLHGVRQYSGYDARLSIRDALKYRLRISGH